jgi:hypothetical protein
LKRDNALRISSQISAGVVDRTSIAGGAFGAVRMIHALNFTDFLFRPRRPEELRTEDGGGVIYSQAAHQVDVVRLVAGNPVTRVRALTGNWDPIRPLETGADSVLIGDFSHEDMRRAVVLNSGRPLLEVSGVNLQTVRDIAATGVDRISIGKLTKDTKAVDYLMRVL